jgi:hypothetical protein
VATLTKVGPAELLVVVLALLIVAGVVLAVVKTAGRRR